MPAIDIEQAASSLGCERIDIRPSDRAKRLTVSVYPDGRVAVTVPRRVSQRTVSEFLRKEAGWISRQLQNIKKRPDAVYLPAGRADYLRHKERCRAFVTACLGRHNLIYGFRINRIAIKNLCSRWGSCSEDGNLNFNYKIVHLPGDLAEYIVVHELCHLREMNHSARFWRLVSLTVPDYRERRKQIGRYLL